MSDRALSATLNKYYRWQAHLYDSTRWAFLFGRTPLIRMAAEGIRPVRILEVGCGTGKNLAELARVFPEAEIIGLDLSTEMLRKARKKTQVFGSRVSLLQRVYNAPVSDGTPFDLIVFSYCLSMINPGFAEVLQVCLDDLGKEGHVAVVDFHDTGFTWFRRWMGLNHVRMQGQVLAAVAGAGLTIEHCEVRSAYGGLWRWFACVAKRKTGMFCA